MFVLYIKDLCNTSTILNLSLPVDDLGMSYSHQISAVSVAEVTDRNDKIALRFHTNGLSLDLKRGFMHKLGCGDGK